MRAQMKRIVRRSTAPRVLRSILTVGQSIALSYFVVLLAANRAAAATDGWPQFRGPGGQGHAAGDDYPVEWDTTKNVRWKIDVPGRGWSSPAIDNGQLWLTTATDGAHSLRAICIDPKDGNVVRDLEVFHLDNPGSVHSKNSHASPTPVIEGERVYVHFGAHGTACLNRQGDILWTKKLEYAHGHGPGGSPVVWRDLLIINCDGTDVQYVVALDAKSGETRWQIDRAHISEERRTGKSNVPMAYTTPLLVEADGKSLLLSAGSDQISAYDPATGDELWWANYDGYSNVSQPAYANGMVFICSGYDSPIFYGIRSGGTGDVTKTHIAWSLEKGAPLDPSPLAVGDELYIVSSNGIATCLDMQSGMPHWQQRLGGKFSASPTLAGGNIYWLDEEGKTTVTRASKEFEKLAVNDVDEQSLATPAFLDGAIFLRTEAHLYRIENGK
jgi:outer membrane protein assembly factor BamB